MKGWQKVVVAIASLGFVIGAIGVIGMTDTLGSITGDDTPSDQQPELSGDHVDFSEYQVPLEVRSPIASDLDATIYKTTAHEDGEFGDYVEYDPSEAQKQRTAGVDYVTSSATGERIVTFDSNTELDQATTYDIAVVDTAAEQEYHTLFTEGTTPDTVRYSDWENDRAETLVESSEFDRLAAYSEDDSEIVTINGETAEFEDFETSPMDLAGSAYDAEETDVTVQRVLEYQHGLDYLGEVNVVDASAHVDEATLTVMDETGEELFNEVIVDDGDIESLDEIAESDNPEKVGNELSMSLELTFDGAEVTADEVLVEFGLDDIYGDAVGEDATVSLLA